MSADYIRAGALALASHTGWGEREILAMPASRFGWWLDGLPKAEQ